MLDGKNSPEGSPEWRFQIKPNDLKVLSGFYPHTLNIAEDWAKLQWVYVYLFSDLTSNSKGFGAFVSKV